jgi:hypothetical protein
VRDVLPGEIVKIGADGVSSFMGVSSKYHGPSTLKNYLQALLLVHFACLNTSTLPGQILY